jgi:hypothetical protein
MNVRTLDSLQYEGKTVGLQIADAGLYLANIALGYEVLNFDKDVSDDSKIVVTERAQRTQNVFARFLAGFIAFTVLLPITFTAFVIKSCLMESQGKQIADLRSQAITSSKKNQITQEEKPAKPQEKKSSPQNPPVFVKPPAHSNPIDKPVKPKISPEPKKNKAPIQIVIQPKKRDLIDPSLKPQEAVKEFYRLVLETDKIRDEDLREQFDTFLERNDSEEILEIIRKDWDSSVPSAIEKVKGNVTKETIVKGEITKEAIQKIILKDPRDKSFTDVAVWTLHPKAAMFDVD